jgi:hypothetical protein
VPTPGRTVGETIATHEFLNADLRATSRRNWDFLPGGVVAESVERRAWPERVRTSYRRGQISIATVGLRAVAGRVEDSRTSKPSNIMQAWIRK